MIKTYDPSKVSLQFDHQSIPGPVTFTPGLGFRDLLSKFPTGFTHRRIYGNCVYLHDSGKLLSWDKCMEIARVRQNLIQAWPWIILGIRRDLAQEKFQRITNEEFQQEYGLDIPVTEESE